MPFAEDLCLFFNPAELGVDGLLDGVAVRGIFTSSYSQVFDGVAGADTTFVMASSEASAAGQASVLVIHGVSWRVRSVQPDGTGVSTLLLGRV